MWIYQKELENGIYNFPKISKVTQAKARKVGKIKWIKIGRHIVYQKEWIEEYLENNMRKAEATKKWLN